MTEAGHPSWPFPTRSKCQEAAERIQDRIGGDAIHITPASPGAASLGPSEHDPFGRWTDHYAVQKDDRIYDAWTGPEGRPAAEYADQWDYSEDLAIEIVELAPTQDVRLAEAEDEPDQDPEGGWRQQPGQQHQAGPAEAERSGPEVVREWMHKINREEGREALRNGNSVWAFVSDPANHPRLPEGMTSGAVRAVCKQVDQLIRTEKQAAAQAAQPQRRLDPKQQPPPPPPPPRHPQGPTFG